MKCTSLTANGKPCRRRALAGKDVCMVHDPKRRKEVVAIANKAARAGRRKKAKENNVPTNSEVGAVFVEMLRYIIHDEFRKVFGRLGS